MRCSVDWVSKEMDGDWRSAFTVLQIRFWDTYKKAKFSGIEKEVIRRPFIIHTE